MHELQEYLGWYNHFVSTDRCNVIQMYATRDDVVANYFRMD